MRAMNFTLEYRDVFIQIPIDENFPESVDYALGWLRFVKQYVKVKQADL